MSTGTSIDLHGQISAVEADPRAVRRLAEIYHHSLAERLAARIPVSFGADPSRVTWLHPRVVRAVRVAERDPERFAPMIGDVLAGLAAGAGTPPPREHLPGGDAGSWYLEDLAGLASDVRKVDDSYGLRPAAGSVERYTAWVEEAAGILARVWPQAAVELDALVRVVVYVEGAGFRSATLRGSFGAVYAGTGFLDGVPACFEMLLHEAGHHSLYLRNAFQVFVTNAAEVASHPLRPDPRPIGGIVHAAHVLCRMTTGLAKWSREPDAPAEARARRDDAFDRFSRTLGVLRERARWTPAGERYFAGLLAREAALAGRAS